MAFSNGNFAGVINSGRGHTLGPRFPPDEGFSSAHAEALMRAATAPLGSAQKQGDPQSKEPIASREAVLPDATKPQ